MSLFYVTSEMSAQGKTATCSSIANLSMKSGLNTSIVKIVTPSTAIDNAVSNYASVLPNDIGVVATQLINEASAHLKDLKGSSDLVLVEGDSSVAIGDQKKFVAETDANVIVISDYVNGTDCAEYAKSFGANLKGVILNFVPQYAETNVREYLVPEFESLGVTILGTIAEDRCLLSVSVAQIAEHLGGRFFSGEDLPNVLVKNFMVGGFGMDPGEYVFSTKSDKCVVVRGDRPDVQMSALQTDVSCFIMTNGIDPIEYVQYESQEEKVPIIVVEKDTLQTMDDVGKLQSEVSFDHPEKLERMSSLIGSSVDLKILIEGL